MSCLHQQTQHGLNQDTNTGLFPGAAAADLWFIQNSSVEFRTLFGAADLWPSTSFDLSSFLLLRSSTAPTRFEIIDDDDTSLLEIESVNRIEGLVVGLGWVKCGVGLAVGSVMYLFSWGVGLAAVANVSSCLELADVRLVLGLATSGGMVRGWC
ncbi:hypothetical protein Pint_10128 [Pistacia integerrima]|uniref:Uncharacterized protein n=1 Tax=Pistacia integerrima TaxID=434235 RepID=A0ACC0XHH5_9ROSI|nr:hypothetical protein Pint_10128 [Pistacia integerrima]